jgi:transcriptional regulator with XRE-family HTH domain
VPANPDSETVVTGTAQIGHAIRRERERRGLDQGAFADLADVHRTYVSKFENETPRDTIGRLLRMLNALDLELVIRPKRRR